jgi:hypothetical protein
MYNKLFTSILDSSIWLEEPTTKVVWVTLMAAMDEDSFAHFSAIQNLANRAVLSLSDTEAAVKILESPDPNSADPEFDGRRIERVPGGYLVLNAKKYSEFSTRAIAREKVRKRVEKHRLKKHIADETPKPRNAHVTPASKNTSEKLNAAVTPVLPKVPESKYESESKEQTDVNGEYEW